jgi:calcineurin-like phosphoesterase
MVGKSGAKHITFTLPNLKNKLNIRIVGNRFTGFAFIYDNKAFPPW